MAEELGMVHMHGRGLIQEWWWPVGPKLTFHQMAALGLEIIDSSGTYVIHKNEEKLNTWNNVVKNIQWSQLFVSAFSEILYLVNISYDPNRCPI